MRGRGSRAERGAEAATRGIRKESARQGLLEWERERGSDSRNRMR